MKPRDRLAINLRKARRAAGLSQEDLDGHCELHRTEISLLERGGREPRLTTLHKLSSTLGVSIEDLVAGISWNIEKQRFEYDARSTT